MGGNGVDVNWFYPCVKGCNLEPPGCSDGGLRSQWVLEPSMTLIHGVGV